MRLPILTALILLVLAAPALAAPAVTVLPSSIDTTGKISTDGAAPVYVVRTDYDAFGVWFSDAGVNTAIINDVAAPEALIWTGVNAANSVDFVSPVNARIVVPGSGGVPAKTSRVTVEAGYVDTPGNVRLEAYDCAGRLIASTNTADAATGPHGRSQFTISSAEIQSIRVIGVPADKFGVDQIALADTAPCLASAAVVLAPATASPLTSATHTLTATVTESGEPVSGRTVTFTVVSGPNAGLTRTATTNGAGVATASYPGTAAGTDVIEARFDALDRFTRRSNRVSVEWRPDADADGVADSADNCPNAANPDQADGDKDNVGDACDPLFDADGDAVADAIDNCPGLANPDQADGDKDGAGDACDGLFDTDRDLVRDAVDNCPSVANAAQVDTDKDGIGDACDGLLDSDRDGVGDLADNCPDVANANQADADKDKVGDACDILPPGDRPVVVGTTARVAAVSGDVFIKLPPGTAAAARASRAAARISQNDAPIEGFVPIKGVATVPIGSQIDARRGQIELQTAPTFSRAGARSRLQQGRFAAALFAIRQARARKAKQRARRPTTDLKLLSPPGTERACAAASTFRPIKGVVRTLSAVAKGSFRAIGGASTTTATNATWLVSDRCDGTLTEVGSGTATVRSSRTGREFKVHAGQGYLVRARLFAARQRS